MRTLFILTAFLAGCALSVPAAGPARRPAPPTAATPAPAPASAPAGEPACPNHCLPEGTVFAIDDDDPEWAYVAVPTDAGPWLYVRSDVLRGRARTVDTAPATASNISPGATIIVYNHGDSVPSREGDATHGTWRVHTIASIDGATLVTATGASVSLASSRIVR